MSEKEKRISDRNVTTGEKAKQVPPKSGLFHTVIDCANIAGPSGDIQYQRAPNEQVMTNNGAWIVLGSDRPNSLRSGFGSKGGCRAASIDLVVGRLATARKGKGPKENAHVNPDFSADAARIFIGQQTNVDHNFGVSEGHAPQSKARSAIGMKADAVRIIGREGIKLVTGGMQDVRHQPGGEPTSGGKKIKQPSPCIEFIAGNSIADRTVWGGLFNITERIRGLQPICLGHNTRDAFRELADFVDYALSTIDAVADAVNKMFVCTGIQLWMTPVAIQATASVLENVLRGKMSVNVLRSDLALFSHRYLTAGSYKCIWSRRVKAT